MSQPTGKPWRCCDGCSAPANFLWGIKDSEGLLWDFCLGCGRVYVEILIGHQTSASLARTVAFIRDRELVA